MICRTDKIPRMTGECKTGVMLARRMETLCRTMEAHRMKDKAHVSRTGTMAGTGMATDMAINFFFLKNIQIYRSKNVCVNSRKFQKNYRQFVHI